MFISIIWLKLFFSNDKASTNMAMQDYQSMAGGNSDSTTAIT
jgi:hypothetical protein